MELTRDFEAGIVERIQQDQGFALALLDEVNEALSRDERGAAQGMLRALTAGTVGFDQLACALSTTSQSLQHMLAPGNTPQVASLRTIANVLKLALAPTTS